MSSHCPRHQDSILELQLSVPTTLLLIQLPTKSGKQQNTGPCHPYGSPGSIYFIREETESGTSNGKSQAWDGAWCKDAVHTYKPTQGGRGKRFLGWHCSEICRENRRWSYMAYLQVLVITEYHIDTFLATTTNTGSETETKKNYRAHLRLRWARKWQRPLFEMWLRPQQGHPQGEHLSQLWVSWSADLGCVPATCLGSASHWVYPHCSLRDSTRAGSHLTGKAKQLLRGVTDSRGAVGKGRDSDQGHSCLIRSLRAAGLPASSDRQPSHSGLGNKGLPADTGPSPSELDKTIQNFLGTLKVAIPPLCYTNYYREKHCSEGSWISSHTHRKKSKHKLWLTAHGMLFF